MNPLMQSDPLRPHLEDCMRSHRSWPWFLILGGLLMVVGVMAIGAAFIATLATVLVFGWLMLIGGIAQTLNAFLARSWRGFLVYLLGGILHLVVGGMMIEHPLRAAEALTLMIAVIFLASGILRIAFSLNERAAGWQWLLLNGVITLLLGLAIWRQWPESSLWVIGLFVGVDLVFNGWSWVMIGLVLKALKPGEKQPAEPASPTQTPA